MNDFFYFSLWALTETTVHSLSAWGAHGAQCAAHEGVRTAHTKVCAAHGFRLSPAPFTYVMELGASGQFLSTR
jgi:hypothetical protein